MAVRNKLHYLLIHNLQITKKEAFSLLEKGNVRINGVVQNENVFFEPTDTICYNEQVLQEGKKIISIAFYKPRGIETTLNLEIADNLKAILPFPEIALFPVGRLDKESEGLLLLTNDGKLYKELLHSEKVVEKEYVVEVNQAITSFFLTKMANGVQIMGKTTLPCRIIAISETVFNIILTQGLNRQIRRMCYQLGYEVLALKRIRIGMVELEELEVGAFRRV
ncbi:MAG: hypothetical protein RLZZ292_770 [Bacteroidota bacterium]|jgi:23S rRNA pseudouridine2604 synthase